MSSGDGWRERKEGEGRGEEREWGEEEKREGSRGKREEGREKQKDELLTEEPYFTDTINLKSPLSKKKKKKK